MEHPTSTARWPALALCALWAAAAVGSFDDPVVGRDSWRESDVLMVARNFCREKTPLTQPRIDARGDGTGITGMELPLLNWAAGALSCAGMDLALAARLLVALCTLLGASALFAITSRELGERTALLALVFFLFSPLVLYYGRAAMPDMPAVALALCALWLLQAGLERSSRPQILLSALAFAVAGLEKPPALSLGLVGVAWALRRPFRWTWIFYALVSLLPPLLWLRHARHLQDEYGLHYFNLSRSPGQLWADWSQPGLWLRAFLQHPFDTYVFPLVTVFALIGVWISPELRWLRAMGAAALACTLLSGAVGGHHSYYGLPVVPFLCIAGAWAAQRLTGERRAWQAALACAAVLYGHFRVRDWFARPETWAAYAQARDAIWATRPLGEKVVLFSGGNPSLLWLVDRRGWVDPGSPDWVREGKLPSKVVLIDHRPVDPPPAVELEAALRGQRCQRQLQNARVSLWIC